MNKNVYHIPALLEESIKGLNINPSGVYVDATFGAGGHSREILNKLDENGKLFVFDRDEDAKNNSIDDNRVKFTLSNYRYFTKFLKLYGIQKVDGILADFGVSFYQFDTPDRGFSIKYNSDLDMRMNSSQGLSAYNVINDYKPESLEKIFRDYGEISGYKKLVEDIVIFRNNSDIKTTTDLLEAIKQNIPKFNQNKYLAKVFQAIRIEVNEEIDSIKEFLITSENILNKRGRLCIISYHSLEDREVKRFFKNGTFDIEPKKDLYGNIDLPFEVITKKPIIPSYEEIKNNPRSRSAKLRICEKK